MTCLEESFNEVFINYWVLQMADMNRLKVGDYQDVGKLEGGLNIKSQVASEWMLDKLIDLLEQPMETPNHASLMAKVLQVPKFFN